MKAKMITGKYYDRGFAKCPKCKRILDYQVINEKEDWIKQGEKAGYIEDGKIIK